MVSIRQKCTFRGFSRVYSIVSLVVAVTCLKSPQTGTCLLGYLLLCSEKGSCVSEHQKGSSFLCISGAGAGHSLLCSF